VLPSLQVHRHAVQQRPITVEHQRLCHRQVAGNAGAAWKIRIFRAVWWRRRWAARATHLRRRRQQRLRNHRGCRRHRCSCCRRSVCCRHGFHGAGSGCCDAACCPAPLAQEGRRASCAPLLACLGKQLACEMRLRAEATGDAQQRPRWSEVHRYTHRRRVLSLSLANTPTYCAPVCCRIHTYTGRLDRRHWCIHARTHGPGAPGPGAGGHTRTGATVGKRRARACGPTASYRLLRPSHVAQPPRGTCRAVSARGQSPPPAPARCRLAKHGYTDAHTLAWPASRWRPGS
jgi:hypothetical protein